ncbi:MAG: ImmA/IrrE family metallo-endopeptidase [Pseudomonadota bacterium]
MDEAEIQQRARAFAAPLDLSYIRDDLSVYATAANAKVVEEELNEGESGYTATTPKGRHIITVNSLEPPQRRRFTVCHEVAHIVLGLPSNHEEVPSWSYAKRDPNEMFCDIFAAELLMPYALWRAKVPRDEPSADVIDLMAAEFRVSFPAAASRFAALSDFPCAWVTMERGLIRYTAMSTSLRKVRAWIVPRTPIPQGSVAHRLRETGQSGIAQGEVAQDLWFQDWDKGLDLREVARHYASTDTTGALLWFEEDELPQVEIGRFGQTHHDDGGLPELTGELPWPSGKKRR